MDVMSYSCILNQILILGPCTSNIWLTTWFDIPHLVDWNTSESTYLSCWGAVRRLVLLDVASEIASAPVQSGGEVLATGPNTRQFIIWVDLFPNVNDWIPGTSLKWCLLFPLKCSNTHIHIFVQTPTNLPVHLMALMACRQLQCSKTSLFRISQDQ